MGIQLYLETHTVGGVASGTFAENSQDPNQGTGITGDEYTYTIDLSVGETLQIGGDWGNGISNTQGNGGGDGGWTLLSGPSAGFSLDSSTGVFSYTLTVGAGDIGNTITWVIRDGNFPGPNYDQDTVNLVITCFAAGSQIATPLGETSVDALTIGDEIVTATGETVSVKWIGRQTVTQIFAGPRMQPVRFRAGSLGQGLPHSDLTVTADHGMVVDGMVINASALVNGKTIDFVPAGELPDRVTYFHIETENHDVILANGAPAETFVDNVGRQVFDNFEEYVNLYGAERIIPEMNRPRISSRRLVPAGIKAQLGIEDLGTDAEIQLTA